jgi:hypothetical protein
MRVPHNYLGGQGAAPIQPLNPLDTAPVKQPSYIEAESGVLAAYHRLRVLTYCTAAVHLCTFSVMLVLIVLKMEAGGPRIGRGAVHRIASCWGGRQPPAGGTFLSEIAYGSITNKLSTEEGGFERHYMIAFLLVAFFLLSATFQFCAVRSASHKESILNNKPQWFRYVEYSLSASCMIVAIFVSFGVLESYLHVSAFALTMLCMLIGLVADCVRYLSDTNDLNIPQVFLMKLRRVALGLHNIAWVPMAVVWGIIWVLVLDLAMGTFWEVCESPAEGGKVPWFVWFVTIGQFMLFNAFGYVQRLQFRKQFDIYRYTLGWSGLTLNPSYLCPNPTYDPVATGMATEWQFVVLSLVAKSLLGWTIFSQVLMA